jgi:hypothetical protein
MIFRNCVECDKRFRVSKNATLSKRCGTCRLAQRRRLTRERVQRKRAQIGEAQRTGQAPSNKASAPNISKRPVNLSCGHTTLLPHMPLDGEYLLCPRGHGLIEHVIDPTLRRCDAGHRQTRFNVRGRVCRLCADRIIVPGHKLWQQEHVF